MALYEWLPLAGITLGLWTGLFMIYLFDEVARRRGGLSKTATEKAGIALAAKRKRLALSSKSIHRG